MEPLRTKLLASMEVQKKKRARSSVEGVSSEVSSGYLGSEEEEDLEIPEIRSRQGSH